MFISEARDSEECHRPPLVRPPVSRLYLVSFSPGSQTPEGRLLHLCYLFYQHVSTLDLCHVQILRISISPS